MTAPAVPPARLAGRQWRGQSPEERRQGRRRRLLDAGLALFGTDGYAATSLTALCATAGVSPRHFYELYADRAEVLGDLYGELVTEMGQLVRTAQDQAAVTVEGLVGDGLRAAVEFQTSDPRRARVVQVEIMGVSPALDRHRRGIIAAFGDLVEEANRRLVADGQLVDRPLGGVAVGLVGAADEVLTEWLVSDPRCPATELMPVIEEIFYGVFERRRAAPGPQPESGLAGSL